MSLSFLSASHSGQPSGLGPFRYSMRQGAQSGCAASGVGPLSVSAIRQLLEIVVFDAPAEVVELPGGAVSGVAEPLVEAMRRLEPGVGPELNGGGAKVGRFGLHDPDEPLTEPEPARRPGDVQLL